MATSRDAAAIFQFPRRMSPQISKTLQQLTHKFLKGKIEKWMMDDAYWP